MPKYLTLKEAFKKCEIEGKFIPQKDVDIDKIKAMVEISKSDLESSRELKNLSKVQWSSVYKLYYDELHDISRCFFEF